MAGNLSQPGASVVQRMYDLLGAFDAEHRRLTLTELSRRSGLPLSTVHRLAAELVAVGALERTAAGGYVIGRRLWSLGLLAPNESGIREIASPFLHDLYAATLATVHLAVRDGSQVLYLDRISGQRSVPVVSNIGSRLPLHSTGVGKALLAYAPEEIRRAVLGDLERITPYTVTQPSRLAAQLHRFRVDGYATTHEEMTIGACSVAVPVRRGDEVIAALGIVVASLKRDRPRLVAALQVAAHGIARSLD